MATISDQYQLQRRVSRNASRTSVAHLVNARGPHQARFHAPFTQCLHAHGERAGATAWSWYAARYSRSVYSRQCGPAASSNGGSHASTLGCEYMASSDAMFAAAMARTVSSRCGWLRAKLNSRETQLLDLDGSLMKPSCNQC